MFSLCTGHVTHVRDLDGLVQELTVALDKPKETRRALNYLSFTDRARPGDKVLLNTTAQDLGLGTGGWDFVAANLELRVPENASGRGHVMKARYLPSQHSVLTLEEQPEHAAVWNLALDGMPVLVGQLHSQIGPAAAGLIHAGMRRVAYIMTDAGALPLGFSNSVRDLKRAGFLAATFTCGQAFGGDYETVTLHSALLAARHIAACDCVVVCQGPGNAGTATKYGFSGIEQAQNLDIAKALGGTAIAIVRMSEADSRERHRGISHHTRTTLDLTYSRCIVPVPEGVDTSSLPPGHDIHEVSGTDVPISELQQKHVDLTSMGRTYVDDPAYFHAAAAAGLVVGLLT